MRPADRLKTKVELENLWLFVLSSMKKPVFGKELRSSIEKRFGFLAGTVTAYKVLYLLESGGFVRSVRNGRRVYYSITPAGRRQLSRAKSFLRSTAAKL